MHALYFTNNGQDFYFYPETFLTRGQPINQQGFQPNPKTYWGHIWRWTHLHSLRKHNTPAGQPTGYDWVWNHGEGPSDHFNEQISKGCPVTEARWEHSEASTCYFGSLFVLAIVAVAKVKQKWESPYMFYGQWYLIACMLNCSSTNWCSHFVYCGLVFIQPPAIIGDTINQDDSMSL